MRFLLLFSASFFSFGASDASAHHPWDGAVLTKWYQGLISGFGHPVLGLDHVAFLVAVGLLCSLCFRDRGALWAFVPATIAGVFAYLFLSAGPMQIPFYETAVSLTVALAGVLVFSGGLLSRRVGVFFVGLFGIFHGYAYGGGIVGAENSPFIFYLAGLAIVQTAVVFTIAFFASKLERFLSGSPGYSNGLLTKAAGALLFAAGTVMSFQSL